MTVLPHGQCKSWQPTRRKVLPHLTSECADCQLCNGEIPALLLLVRPITATQFGHDFIGRLAGLVPFIRRKGNSADARVSAAAIALANFGQIFKVADLCPGIRTDRNFGAEAALAESDRVDAVGMQIVRNEFVVALEFVVGHIEEDGAVLALGPSRRISMEWR